MKLLKQTSLNFISASVFFFLIAIIIVYISMRLMGNYYLETELNHKKEQFSYDFLKSEKPTNHFNIYHHLISKNEFKESFELLSDTIIYSPATKTYQLNKQLTFHLKKDQKYYKVLIFQSQSFIDIYVMVFSLSLIVLVGLLFIILFIVNRQSIKGTLRVFYQTIEQLSSFNVNDKLNLDQETDINEFRHLNKALNLMSERIKQDFLNLKQYSENTSHELQTPLAILNAKLEELLQSDNLTEKQLIEISGLISTVDRLSNINKALIFLTKIDNRIFVDKENVHIKPIIENQIDLYRDLIDSRELQLSLDLKSNFIVKGNKLLVETLLNNLIGNAIKHNVDNGEIKIQLAQNTFIIENTGKELSVPVDQLFKRFEKGTPGAKSTGIGLSIVKKICDTSDFKIIYESENIWHKISIHF